MTDFVEARSGVPFKLDGKEFICVKPRGGADLELKTAGSRHLDSIMFGEFVGKDWEVARPYTTNPFHDEPDPDVVAVLVQRSKRYRTALAARDFIKEEDLHEDPGPVGLRAIFRSMGGTVIQPGGLSDRDAERFPGRTARIHGPRDITLFLQEGEDETRRRELMALVIAVRALGWESYEDGYDRGPLDLSLGAARNTHPDAHVLAAMLLVPQADAAGAVDIATAEEIGAELKVDPCTVQDAHQLWNEITNPELPKG
jgi:hypothetical protein